MKTTNKLKIYMDHRAAILEYAVSLTGSRETAEDIVQDAYFRFVTKPNKPSQPVSYLYRIVRNLAFDLTRKLAVEHRFTQEDATPWVIPNALPQPETTFEYQQKIHSAQQLLEAMPIQTAKALKLYRFEGYTLEQTAASLNVSTSTAHRLVREALTQLSQLIED